MLSRWATSSRDPFHKWTVFYGVFSLLFGSWPIDRYFHNANIDITPFQLSSRFLPFSNLIQLISSLLGAIYLSVINYSNWQGNLTITTLKVMIREWIISWNISIFRMQPSQWQISPFLPSRSALPGWTWKPSRRRSSMTLTNGWTRLGGTTRSSWMTSWRRSTRKRLKMGTYSSRSRRWTHHLQRTTRSVKDAAPVFKPWLHVQREMDNMVAPAAVVERGQVEVRDVFANYYWYFFGNFLSVIFILDEMHKYRKNEHRTCQI